MYFEALSEQRMTGWRPYPNYLFAIAEWHLKHVGEPLEIIARKIQKYYPDPGDFVRRLRSTLYQGFVQQGDDLSAPTLQAEAIRSANPTLDSVARMCTRHGENRAVRSVISYNYDSLLELSIGDHPHQPVYGNTRLDADKLPIYHVHGYVPMSGDGSPGEDIVFTEDQYHRIAQNPYFWSNLIQIQAMTRSVGLMVGLSLSDRNMRQLLDAVQRAPIQAENYALLRKPKWDAPSNEDLDEIHSHAIEYLGRFRDSGVKADSRCREQAVYSVPGVKSSRPIPRLDGAGGDAQYRVETRGILDAVREFDKEEQDFVLSQLGICPIWYEDYSEVPQILEAILSDGE